MKWHINSESRGYWTWCWRVESTFTRLRSCWRRTFYAHSIIKMTWCNTCEFLRLQVMFATIQLIISEPTHELLSMNSLLQTAKLQLWHFTR